MLWSPFCGKDIQSWLCARQCQWHPDTCAGLEAYIDVAISQMNLKRRGCSKHICVKNRIFKCVSLKEKRVSIQISVSTLTFSKSGRRPCEHHALSQKYSKTKQNRELFHALCVSIWNDSKDFYGESDRSDHFKSDDLWKMQNGKTLERFAVLNRSQAWDQHICDTHPFS